MNLKDTKIALINICDAIVSEENLLTEADSSIGDGDHGIGMTRGFKEAKNRLENSLVMSISECFSIVGNSLLLKSGGASGAIFGTFFNTASKSLIQEKQLNKKNFCRLLDVGLEAVNKIGNAIPGDKTMVDALDPACRAAASKESFGEAVRAARDAACEGVEKTKNMIAKHGKAKSLGTRSLGHPDPGAITFSLILRALDDHLKREAS